MTHAFPEKTVDLILHDSTRYKKECKGYSEKKLFWEYWNIVKKQTYYFRHNLHTGIYTHYPHEMMDARIGGFNCTNIIPYAYLFFEGFFNVKPQIVQFKGFRDINKRKDKGKDLSENPFEDSHFSLIVTLPKENKKYLVDPFWEITGQIREEGTNYLKLRSLKREFSEILYYSEQEFADMMTRLKDPAESLDMLIAGQKVGYANFHTLSCSIMIYYKEETNTLTTRLLIPQPGLQKKVVYYNMHLNKSGEVEKKTLDFYVCKDAKWTKLIKGKKIATLNHSEFAFLRRNLRKIGKIDIHERIGQKIVKLEDESLLEKILETAKKAHDGLTTEEVTTINKTIQARSLYEYSRGTENYLFDAKKHDEKIHDFNYRCNELSEERENIRDVLFRVFWKLEKLPQNEVRTLRRRSKALEKERKKIAEDLDELNSLRFNRKKLYSRLRDLRVFADYVEKMKSEEVDSSFAVYQCNPLIGYLATLADFIPYVAKTEKELTLSFFMSSIKEKVKARREKKKIVLSNLDVKMES